MQIVTFRQADHDRVGIVVHDRVFDIGSAVSSVLELVRGEAPGLVELQHMLDGGEFPSSPLTEVQLRSPIPQPVRDIYATGWNYQDHFDEGRDVPGRSVVDPPEHPAFFSKATGSVVGPHDDILIDPAVSEMMDYEAEIAVVIGKAGKNIDETNALEHVFGYMLANDVSARDLQKRHGGQWLKGKGLDDTCPLGPWLVTANEIKDPQDLSFECLLNGRVRQRGSTRQMAFPVRRLIAELSFGMSLVPGDILLTGTPSGVGFARTPPEWLRPGDELITRSPRLGKLRNTIALLSDEGRLRSA